MNKEQLIAYIRDGLDKGHSLDELTAALVQNGWPEKDIKSAALVATAPKMDSAPPAAPAAPAEEKVPEPEPKRIVPKHYTSPLSVILAIVLFFALLFFTGQVLTDISSVVTPYAPDDITDTAQYKKMKGETDRIDHSSPAYQELLQNYKENHSSDKVKSLLVTGIASTLFWILAFVIHISIGRNQRQFYVLSLPYFLVAGLYLLLLIVDTISILFAKESVYAIYITLILIAVAVTGAFVFYQKRVSDD